MIQWMGTSIALFFCLCAIGILLSAMVRGRWTAVAVGWIGALCSLLLMAAAVLRLGGGADLHQALWKMNGWGSLSIHVDALSAVFLFVAGLVYLSCCLFAPHYFVHYSGESYPVRRYGILHFALMAAVALVLVAGDALTFLISWECMSILTYLLVNYEQTRQTDTAAGYLMLGMSEAGFLAIVVAFLIAGSGAADFGFDSLRGEAGHLSAAEMAGVFVLGFAGFGVKAGLLPVNFWLPRCYTASPVPFAPILAGVTLNLGFYGIFRLNGDLVPGNGIGPGIAALVIGSVTAIVGILYATTENDLKTMLAHSSIENAGIIVAAFGAFLVFRNSANPVPAAIALTAALYHMANHSVYKALLFQGAGHIEAATGTRDMDRLGGLIRLLPSLSITFLIGCLAIAAVPPFNGFVSEWLTLQTMLRSAVLSAPLVKIVFALCGALLALTAALAVTCFVKTYSMSFLGIRRGSWHPAIGAGRRQPSSLVILALACILLGVLPTYVIPALDRAVQPMAGASVTAALVPPFFSATTANGQLPAAFLKEFHNLGAQTGSGLVPGRGLVMLLRGGEHNPVVFAMSPSYSVVALVLLVLIVWGIVGRTTRRRQLARRELWAGGIPRLLPQMSYTATGFSNPVRVVFQAVFRPNIVEDTRETVAVHFRTAIRRRREETHVVDRAFFHPMGDAVNWIARSLAKMHHGKLNAYVTYSLVSLVLLLFLDRIT
jgi:hydrogenase-4 component B